MIPENATSVNFVPTMDNGLRVPASRPRPVSAAVVLHLLSNRHELVGTQEDDVACLGVDQALLV